MERIEVDTRGLSCPQPVTKTKEALARMGAGDVVVLVDNDIARDNVSRFAASQRCTVSVQERAGGFELTITKDAAQPACDCQPAAAPTRDGAPVYLFDSDYIGTNRDLGKVLTNGFINAALNLEAPAGAIVLISNGVRLASEGSYALEVLGKAAAQGFDILICGTCLDFFKIRDQVRVGTISNALEILECMAGGKVIKF